MGRKRDLGKEIVGLVEERGDLQGGKEAGEDQVAIFVVGGNLARS